MAVSGFTVVRNAEILDYPFKESVLSALPLCQEFIINCGDSQDGTLQLCQDLQKTYPSIRIIHSKWSEHNRIGGAELAEQTNRALKECKEKWCLYIQADEVLHDGERDNLRYAMEIADRREDVDGIVLDYFHFYGSYQYIISGRNWYRKEARLFKNHRGIKSFRDAQGFRKNGKRIQVVTGNARVYHYGYVRTVNSFAAKSKEMSKWWKTDPLANTENLRLVRHVGLKKFIFTHPDVMKERIEKSNIEFSPRKVRRKWDKNEFKNLFTLLWERIFPFRVGEFRNYEVLDLGKHKKNKVTS